jgi:hypothetical protein
MRLLNRVTLLALPFLLAGSPAHAELYRVTVSREAQNLYRVDYASKDVYIKTRYCYVYCYYEEALVDTDRMVIHFLDSEDECDIEKVLTE